MSNAYINDFTNTTVLYYNDLKDKNPLPKDEELALLKEAKKNNIEARNKLIESNLRFVFNIASRYKGMGVPLSDLISEGNLGLEKAIEKFDEKRDTKFIYYAVFWVKEAIKKCLAQNTLKTTFEASYDEMFKKNERIIDNKILSDCEDDKQTPMDVLASNQEIYKSEEVRAKQKAAINNIMSKLTPQQRLIIDEHFCSASL